MTAKNILDTHYKRCIRTEILAHRSPKCADLATTFSFVEGVVNSFEIRNTKYDLRKAKVNDF